MTVYHAYQFMSKRDAEIHYLHSISKINRALRPRAGQYPWSKGTTLPSVFVLTTVKTPFITDDLEHERKIAQSVKPLLDKKLRVTRTLLSVKKTNQSVFLATDVEHLAPVSHDIASHKFMLAWRRGKLTKERVESLSKNEQLAYHQLLLNLQAERAKAIQRAIPRRCVQITRNKLSADPFLLSIDTLSQYKAPRSIFTHLPALQKLDIERRAEHELGSKAQH